MTRTRLPSLTPLDPSTGSRPRSHRLVSPSVPSHGPADAFALRRSRDGPSLTGPVPTVRAANGSARLPRVAVSTVRACPHRDTPDRPETHQLMTHSTTRLTPHEEDDVVD